MIIHGFHRVIIALLTLQLVAGGMLVHIHRDSGHVHTAIADDHHGDAHAGHSHHGVKHIVQRDANDEESTQDPRPTARDGVDTSHSHMDCDRSVNDIVKHQRNIMPVDSPEVCFVAAALAPAILESLASQDTGCGADPPTGPPIRPVLALYLLNHNLRL